MHKDRVNLKREKIKIVKLEFSINKEKSVEVETMKIEFSCFGSREYIDRVVYKELSVPPYIVHS